MTEPFEVEYLTPSERLEKLEREAEAHINGLLPHINELLCSTDPKVRVLAQKLQVILDERARL